MEGFVSDDDGEVIVRNDVGELDVGVWVKSIRLATTYDMIETMYQEGWVASWQGDKVNLLTR